MSITLDQVTKRYQSVPVVNDVSLKIEQGEFTHQALRAIGSGFQSVLFADIRTVEDAQKAVEYGAAHGALASTTPGDTSMATRKEVEKQIAGGGARVVR